MVKTDMAKTTGSSTATKGQKKGAGKTQTSATAKVKSTAVAKRSTSQAKGAAKPVRGAAAPGAKAAAKRGAPSATKKVSTKKVATKKVATTKSATRKVAPKKVAPKAATKPVTKKSAAARRGAAKPTHGKSAPAPAAGKGSGKATAKTKPAATKKSAPVKKPAAGKPSGRKAAGAGAKPAAKKAASGKQAASLHQRANATPKVAGKSPVRKVTQKGTSTSHVQGHSGAGVASAAKPARAASRGKLVATPGKRVKPLGKARAGKSPDQAIHEVPTLPAKPAAVSAAPDTRPFKGRVASATAMVTSRAAKPVAHGDSPHHHKQSSGSMNKTGTAKLENGVTREDGRYALPSTSTIDLPQGYVPSSKDEYMNPKHLAYFRDKLRTWHDQLVEESRQTMDNLRGEVRDVGDDAERATRETENSLELRTRDRYRKLIAKIDKALRRIEDGTYGFCEETDEEIGLERLDARPIATLSLDAQERREHMQKQMGE